MIANAVINREYNRLKKYLDIILSSKLVVDDLIRKNEQLKKAITHSLDIFYFLSDKKNDVAELDEFIAKYNDIVGLKYAVSKTVNFDDEYDLIDDINYLNTVIKNLYGCDINDLPSKSDAQSESEPVIQATEEPRVFSRAQSVQDNKTFAGNDSDFLNPEQMREALNETAKSFAAQQRLRAEIESGIFYIYKTKPREIIFLKYTLFFLFSLISLLSIVFSILILVNNSSSFSLSLDDYQKILGLNSEQIANLRSRLNGADQIQLIPVTSLVVGIILLSISLFSLTKIYRDLWGQHNDNIKYFLSTRILAFISIGILVIFLFNSLENFRSIFIFSLRGKNYFAESASLNVKLRDLFSAIYYIYMIIVILCAVCILLFVSAIFLNPKRDDAKIRDRINTILFEMNR
ncbi:putative membrane protein [Mycoplasmoides fastidiosum]|uniref:Membrane protein n=1 Tax=Mycoplasmoides fastidiosum TaxID=92758 RepID=A0ABU0LYL4_9BACT|nr:hypothetical protein [Mycoplasmoides fastidiosum]MDQ0513775.1 putative membrane protein [Mycoplasmoides fastidiosum]UUD37807.1 hypothetical protein NPA10_00195 [Mycoplasmoides fastidiosum]